MRLVAVFAALVIPPKLYESSRTAAVVAPRFFTWRSDEARPSPLAAVITTTVDSMPKRPASCRISWSTGMLPVAAARASASSRCQRCWLPVKGGKKYGWSPAAMKPTSFPLSMYFLRREAATVIPHSSAVPSAPGKNRPHSASRWACETPPRPPAPRYPAPGACSPASPRSGDRAAPEG